MGKILQRNPTLLGVLNYFSLASLYSALPLVIVHMQLTAEAVCRKIAKKHSLSIGKQTWLTPTGNNSAAQSLMQPIDSQVNV